MGQTARSLDPAQGCQLALQVLATLVHEARVAQSPWLAAKLPLFAKVGFAGHTGGAGGVLRSSVCKLLR